MKEMYPEIEEILEQINFNSISEQRKTELQVLVDYVQKKAATNHPVRLNFICTHNSRRSQFAQIWADVAAFKHGIDIESCSGGVEVTACNERTIYSLERFGFVVEFEQDENPVYNVHYASDHRPAKLFSKLFDDPLNPKNGFGAIMTCSHADENCPYVAGCEQRISLRYEDPKAYDDTAQEEEMYDRRSLQIATEMMYVFQSVSND